MNVITYNSFSANPSEAWMAFVVLSTGKRWLVYSMASTEQEAVAKITTLYEAEINKWKDLPVETKETASGFKNTPAKSGRGQHFIGKVWMIHKEIRDKKRVDASEVAEYESKGYVRGGPRSK